MTTGNDSVQKVIEIQINNDKAIDSIVRQRLEIEKLKKEQEQWKEDLKSGSLSQQDFATKMEASNAVITNNKKSIQALSKEVQNNIKTSDSQEGSLAALRAQLSNTTKEYDSMSRVERESAKGKEMQDKINSITTELKLTEEATQRFYRNVGNYQESFSKALSPMVTQLDDMKNKYMQMSQAEKNSAQGKELLGHIDAMRQSIDTTAGIAGKFQEQLLSMAGVQNGAIGTAVQMSGGITNIGQAFTAAKAGVAAFGAQLLSLLANPIVAILAGVAAAIMIVMKAMDSSKEITGRVNVLLAPLKVLLGAVTGVIQTMAGYILSVVEAGAKMLGFFSGLAEKLPIVGQYFKDINDANKEAIKLAKDKAALGKEERKMITDSAKNERDISDLRTKAKEKEKYSIKERIAMMKKAGDIEEEEAKRSVSLAKMRLQFALDTARIEKDNTPATLTRIAELEAGIYRAQKAYADSHRTILKQMNTLRSEDAADTKAKKDAAKAAAKAAATAAKERYDKEREAVRQGEDVLLALIKDGVEKQRKEINIKYDREIEDLKHKIATEKNLTVKAKQTMNATIKNLELERKKDLQKISEDDIKNQIEKEQKRIELVLASVKAGSDQEYQLKMEALEKQKEAELANIKLTEEEKQLIRNKYAAQEDQLTDQHLNDISKKQADALKLDWENKINEAHLNNQNTLQLELQDKEAELSNLHQLEGESNAEFSAREIAAKQAVVDKKKAINDYEVQIEQVKLTAIGDITGALSGLLEEAGEHSKALAQAGKVLALAEIAINTGKAIAAGTAQAMSVPFPANLAAIATTVATVIANVTSAIKTVKSAKFATGGLVKGSGSGTSDSIPAMLSNGESVMTERATSMFGPILSSFNQIGGGVPVTVQQSSSSIMGENMLARAVAKGVQAMPSPVVSIKEINNISSRVKVVDSLGDN